MCNTAHTQDLRITLEGQLILVDRTPADLSGYVHYGNARQVSYSEACGWLKTSGCHRKPEDVLQFHGIKPPLPAVDSPQRLAQFSVKEDNLSCLCVFDRLAGGAPSLVPLNNDEYGAAILEGVRQNIPFERWIADAIREKLARDKVPSPSPAREEQSPNSGNIVATLTSENGTALGTLQIDEDEAELLRKAAVTSNLELAEFLHFMVLRQMEAFFPPDVKGLYRVSDVTIEEISKGLAAVEKDSTALDAVSDMLVSHTQYIPSSWGLAELRSQVSKWKSLGQTLHELSIQVHIEACDANLHWRIAGRPALLEHHPVKVSSGSAQAAAA